MKELIEQLRSDLLVLCPGVLLLCSLAFWVQPEFESPLWHHETLLGILGFVLAYTLGFLMQFINGQAQVINRPARGVSRAAQLWAMVRCPGLIFFDELWPPDEIGHSPARIGIASRILSSRVAFVLSRTLQLPTEPEMRRPFNSPMEWLALCRILPEEAMEKEDKAAISEAEAQQELYIFGTGTSTAMVLLAAQAFVRLLLLVPHFLRTRWQSAAAVDTGLTAHLPVFNAATLLFLTCLLLWIGSQLRVVAARALVLELELLAFATRKLPGAAAF